MNSELKLPENPDALRDFARDLVKQFQQLQSEKARLQEQINLLLHKRFSANSEKYRAEQADLFNEAEAYAETLDPTDADVAGIDADSGTVAGVETTTEPESAPPRKPGRKALPSELPRVDIVHELPEDRRYCSEGHALKVIGEDIAEQLDIIPAKVQVIRHVRKKYACPCCQAEVTTAPLPPQPIPKSNASPGLLAYVATSKFVDALPLNRQSKLFARLGVELNRATLAHWMIRSGQLIQPLINLLDEALLTHPVLQMDETRIQVLKEKDRAAESHSYLWVRRGGPPAQPVVLFHYAPSRSQAVANQLLRGFSGTVQTDGYAAYASVCANHGLRHAGCWAHARRKFDEAYKATGKGRPKTGKASKALGMIQKLYRIESQIKSLSADDRYRIRQQHAVPLLNEIKTWADVSLTQVVPSSLIGKALAYLTKHWDTLTAYCEDGRLAIDNNAVERAIRPFVIGRNNWLFADTVGGAKASANLYSLIETAKLNALEPYRYLWHIFTELPKAQTLADIEQLLPWAVDTTYINGLK